MAVKRYFAKSDNTITNAYEENLTTRATSSNMGASDILEVFHIYGQADSGSAEESRVLIKFDATASTNSIKADRTAGTIPESGSVEFYLRLFNARHGQTLPKNYTMDVAAIKYLWNEGDGLDMEFYKDKNIISNWTSRASSSAGGEATWTTAGGDFWTDTSSSFTASFGRGAEDIEVNISPLVEQWLNSGGNILGSKDDEGVGIFLSSQYSQDDRSYYTKKFFARGSEFWFKRPCIEARWDSSKKDDRGNFYYSSSLLTGEENLNTFYLYNYFRGKLRNIPSIGKKPIYVSFYSGNLINESPLGEPLTLVADGTHVTTDSRFVVTGGYVSTGIYSASVCITSSITDPLTNIFDVWFSGGHDVANASQRAATSHFRTGSFLPKKVKLHNHAPSEEYATSITNLKSIYRSDETARFRLYARQKDWTPTIYTKATTQSDVSIVESGSYEVYRVVDDLKVIPYGTGSSTLHTQMSFDVSGSYFDLDMKMLETGYMYGIKFAYYNHSVDAWVEQPETFKFRVESRQS
jgi:hypothetical protein